MDLDVPRVIFTEQKVLVTFDSKGEKLGPINKAVYRAIKMRQAQKEKMGFSVMRLVINMQFISLGLCWYFGLYYIFSIGLVV